MCLQCLPENTAPDSVHYQRFKLLKIRVKEQKSKYIKKNDLKVSIILKHYNIETIITFILGIGI